MATQAREILARMKAKGVTTILYNGDPLAPKPLTTKATGQDYFPEWVITGSALVDTDDLLPHLRPAAVGARLRHRRTCPPGSSPTVAGAAYLYEWFNGTPAPATQAPVARCRTSSCIYNGIQYAGPDLTHDSFQQAIFNCPIVEGTAGRPQVSWGDRGIWSTSRTTPASTTAPRSGGTPTPTGIDELNEEGTGMWAYVDGGKRYLPGGMARRRAEPVRQVEGLVTLYTELPDGVAPCPRSNRFRPSSDAPTRSGRRMSR